MPEELTQFEKTVHRASGESRSVTRRIVVEEQPMGIDVRVEEDEENGCGWRTIRGWECSAGGVEPRFPEESQV